ncbi:hypothetical protein Ancab_002376 [Ancistrocladus abbreviatus]
MRHPLLATLLRSFFSERTCRTFRGSITLGELSSSCGRFSHSMSTLCLPSTLDSTQFIGTRIVCGDQLYDSARLSDLDILIAKVSVGSSEDEILWSLTHDEACVAIHASHVLVEQVLYHFKDDWKSALGVFRWAETHPSFDHAPEAYDLMVDILGKTRQFGKMRELVDEMRQKNLVTLKTAAKLMRRFAGAHQWEDVMTTFDELGTFGLLKSTESMNLLLDTLCKENQVEQAREIFLELKSYIPPTAHTFNIFIHGWCKVNRVDEAHWTIQEMKGHGFHPCVISYSTIIQSYCQFSNYNKVYELLDEMEAQGCPPNIVSYTTIMCWLTKSEQFEEALQIAERVRLSRCKLDTLFYNAFIHALGRAGRLREATEVFMVEMPKNFITPNTSTYNTMIAMFCHRGHMQKALYFLKDMEESPFCEPDPQTFYPLLKLCFKFGKTDNCLKDLLDDMTNKHHLSLDVSSYTLLIHGLCRANKCDWAYLLFEEMIDKQLTPRHRTCRLLLDEVKLRSMYDAVERIQVYMKQMKAPK